MTAAPRRTWLHLGVVPTRHGGRRAALQGLASDQYAPVPGLPGAFADGSWEVWGEPETNPHSLHLLTCANPDLSIARQADHLRRNLHRRLRRGSRLVDHAVITTDDWSEIVGIVTFDLSTAYYTALA